MPVHDWSRVSAGTFHDLHTVWIATLRNALNMGLLPEGFYAQAEQMGGEINADVLTLQSHAEAVERIRGRPAGVLAVDEAPPEVSIVAEIDEVDLYAMRQNSLVIRHASDDKIVAILEIVSQGNKNHRASLERFVQKAVSAVYDGIHLMVIDLQPPGTWDPNGIHGAIWEELTGIPFTAPENKPLTVAAYSAEKPFRGFVEPLRVGSVMPDMPLFIDDGLYIKVPLERTYLEAYAGVPERWRRVIEGRDRPS
jgi:hypothetical protein